MNPKKILIISDTHRHCLSLQKVIDRNGPFDMLIHLGDVEGQEDLIEDIAKCPCHIVAGNNDYYCSLPMEKEVWIGRYKVLLTHGHSYRVSMTTELIKEEAISRGCQVAMFGHTHRPLIERSPEITLINPGSLSYPRQENGRGSYILMEIDREGLDHYTICYL